MSAYARSCTTKMPCSLRERDDLLEERQLDALRGRVRREADDQHLRLRDDSRIVRSSSAKKSTSGVMRTERMSAPAMTGAVDVDRIARVGHQHRVAAAERGEHQVRDALLRADGDDRLGVRVEVDVPAALVPVADRAAQPRNALRHRVAVRVAALRRLDQLVRRCARGVGPSGLPMPKSMMSSPRRRAAIFSSVVMLKTYGGRRSMRAKLVCGGEDIGNSLRKRPEPSERRSGTTVDDGSTDEIPPAEPGMRNARHRGYGRRHGSAWVRDRASRELRADARGRGRRLRAGRLRRAGRGRLRGAARASARRSCCSAPAPRSASRIRACRRALAAARVGVEVMDTRGRVPDLQHPARRRTARGRGGAALGYSPICSSSPRWRA